MSAEMFAEAVRAYQGGQRRRARDLLTRLLKAEPNNLDYWIWLSAAVETEKEQVFCLQKALKLDPNSEAARRGLVMLGALRPEEAALPPATPLTVFTPAVPARQAMRAAGGFLANPRNRELLLIIAVSLVAVGLVGSLLVLLFAPQVFFPRAVVVVSSTPPPSATPAPTHTATATATLEPCQIPLEADPAQPLAVYLCLTETPPPPPVPTTASRSEDYASLVAAYQAGEWDKVLAKAGVLRTDQVLSKDATVYFFEGEAHRFQKDPTQAIASYKEALGFNNSLAPAHLGKALAELTLNSLTAAQRSLEAALTADPGHVPAWLTRAQYYEARGNLEQALTDYEQARALAPDSAEVLARLALAYAEAGRPAEASSLAEQAVARDPGQALAYYARGRAALSLGDLQTAHTDLTLTYRYVTDAASFPRYFPVAAALKLDAAYAARALTAVGQAHAALGEDASARQFLDAAIERRPEDLPAAYLARAELSQRAGALEPALADLDSAVSQYRRSAPASAELAQAFMRRGQVYLLLPAANPDKARADFQETLKLTPDRWEATLGLGQAQLALNQPDNAIGTLTLALGLAQTPAEQGPVYLWRAQAFRAAGRTADEIADLQSLSALTEPAGLAPTAQARLTEIGPPATATPSPTATVLTSTPGRTPTATPSPRVTATRTATVTGTPPATPRPANLPAGNPALPASTNLNVSGYPAPSPQP